MEGKIEIVVLENCCSLDLQVTINLLTENFFRIHVCPEEGT
jgi:hypothetical protein